jgi:protein-S-isoprenylcysteine O-methyltransferase Ste14
MPPAMAREQYPAVTAVDPRSVILHTVIFCAMNVLALIRWGHADLWSRLDRYSITAILLLVGMGSMKTRVHAALGHAISGQFFGERFDPSFEKLRSVRRLIDLLTLVDYSQGPLVAAMASPLLQRIGLALAPIVIIWLWRVDSYLIAHFPAALEGAMMQDGPFKRIRHPRYTGLLLGRFAFTALLGSVVGWLHCGLVCYRFSRRIIREERHLRAVFPGQYDAYAHRTGRILPRLRFIDQFRNIG